MEQDSSTDEGNKSADGVRSVSPDQAFCLNLTRAKKQDGRDCFCYIICEAKDQQDKV